MLRVQYDLFLHFALKRFCTPTARRGSARQFAVSNPGLTVAITVRTPPPSPRCLSQAVAQSWCLLLQVNGEAAKSQARSCATKDPPFTEWWRTSWSRGATSPKVHRPVSPCALFRFPRRLQLNVCSPLNPRREWTRRRVHIRRLLRRYWPTISRSRYFLHEPQARGEMHACLLVSSDGFWMCPVSADLHHCMPLLCLARRGRALT